LGDLLIYQDQRRFLTLLYAGPCFCAERDLVRTSQCNNGPLETIGDSLEKVFFGVRFPWFHDSLDSDGVEGHSGKPGPGKPLYALVSRKFEPAILNHPLRQDLWHLRPVKAFLQYSAGPWALPDSFELPGTRGFQVGDYAYSDSVGYLIISPALCNKYGFWP